MPLPFADRLRLLATARPRVSALPWELGRIVEVGLLGVIAVQAAQIVWTLAAPVGAYGVWTERQPNVPGGTARRALLSSFDPFFRAAPVASGSGAVTSLSLKLYGTQVNEASGGGTAIIAGADGVQASYAIGDEIVPGVRLKAVRFDHVLLDRGGAEESLFIDQSTPAPVAGTPVAGDAAVTPVAPNAVPVPVPAPPPAPGQVPVGISPTNPQATPVPPPPMGQPVAGAPR